LKKVENDPPKPALSDIKPDDVCTIIYTSGTTGKPKGVELTHRNICSNIDGGKFLVQAFAAHNTTLSFLPWAHIYGQSTELHSMISGGCALGIAPNRDQILECLSIVRPTMMFSVPVLFNKVYDGVMSNIREQSFIVRGLFKLAMKVSRERNHRLEFGKPVSALLEWEHKILDKIVLSKIRGRLGGRLQ
jgi:long-chain acyl-CoA synthetase